MTNKILSFLCLCCFLVLPSAAKSQSAVNQLLYSPLTPQNLAKSYWSLREMDTDSTDNLDNYLRVTECSLFQQYYKNDIEWSKIREATKGYIKANKNSFPDRFEFIQPINLDRYDTANGEFSITKDSQILGIKVFQASGNLPQVIPCTDTADFNQRLFPINAIITFTQPISYTKVKTSEETAQEYLKYLEENRMKRPEERVAYIRLRFKVDKALDPVSRDNGVFANFFGQLESLTIFGDKDLFIKLEEVDF